MNSFKGSSQSLISRGIYAVIKLFARAFNGRDEKHAHTAVPTVHTVVGRTEQPQWDPCYKTGIIVQVTDHVRCLYKDNVLSAHHRLCSIDYLETACLLHTVWAASLLNLGATMGVRLCWATVLLTVHLWQYPWVRCSKCTVAFFGQQEVRYRSWSWSAAAARPEGGRGVWSGLLLIVYVYNHRPPQSRKGKHYHRYVTERGLVHTILLGSLELAQVCARHIILLGSLELAQVCARHITISSSHGVHSSQHEK
jgi:hypothetical protein